MTDFLIIEELKKAGVQIRTHSPYHFRLDESVDIWPSKNRYRHKGMTNAGDYHGLDSLMEILRDFKKQQARRAHTDRAVKKMKQGDQVLAHPFFGKNLFICSSILATCPFYRAAKN